MFSMMPSAASTTSMLVPPSRDQRQRHAGERQHAEGRAHVDARLADDDGRDARGQQLAEQVLAVQGDAKAHPRQRRIQRQQHQQADQPELLADDAGDHVGGLLGQKAELLHRVAETHPEHPPDAMEMSDCVAW